MGEVGMRIGGGREGGGGRGDCEMGRMEGEFDGLKVNWGR